MTRKRYTTKQSKADISDGRSETVYLPEKWNLAPLVFVVGLLIGSCMGTQYIKQGV